MSEKHPSIDQLRAYSLGRLSEAKSSILSKHIVACETCCHALDELTNQSDEFLRKLQRVSSQEHYSSDSSRDAAPAEQPISTLPRLEGFEVLDELGRGGMGIVYRVRQLGLNRLVALKMISAGVQANPEETLRFRQEAEAVAQLVHPNIVQVYETGTANEIPYFTMEYIEGSSLKEAIAGQAWNPHQSAMLICKLAAAMSVAHQQGIIHRDLKPANVMLVQSTAGTSSQEEGWLHHVTPKITDFGLATRMNDDRSLTQTGTVAGTPGFMAPEQALARRELIGFATDIYGLGAILYNLITGRPPFDADTSIQVLRQLVEQDPVSPRTLNPSVDRDLETICLKCLEKSPGRRYASAQDLADDLNRYLDSKPILARKVSPIEKAWRWSRRNRRLAAVSAALLVVVISAAVAGPIVAFAYRNLAQSEQEAADSAREAQGLADREAAQAKQQRIKAEREAATSNEVSNFLLGLFDDADPLAWSGRAFGVLSEANPTAIEILDRGALSLRDKSVLQDQPLVRATLLDKIGNVYLSLGQADSAQPILAEALQLRQEHLPAQHLDLAASLHSVGFLYFASGNVVPAEDSFKRALAMREALLGDEHPSTLESTVQLGIVYLVPPKRETEGKRLLHRALDCYRARQTDPSRSAAAKGRDVQWMFITLAALAYSDLQSNSSLQRVKAIPLIDEMQQLALAVPNQDLGGIVVHFIDAEKQRNAGKLVAGVSSLLASTHAQQAELEYKQALALGEKTGKQNHYMLAWMRREYGYFLAEQKRFLEAEVEFVEALRVYRNQFRGREASHLSQMLYQTAQCILKGRYQAADDSVLRQEIWTEVNEYLSEAVELGAEAPELTRRQRAIHLMLYGRHLQLANPPRYSESLPHLEESLAIREELFTDQGTQSLQCVALILNAISGQGNWEQTEAIIRKRLPGNSNRQWSARSLPILVSVAERLCQSARPEAAMTLLREAISGGFQDAVRIRESSFFTALQQRQDFQQLLLKLPSAK